MIRFLHTPFQLSVFLSLIRALFPHWNFYDEVGFQFLLQFKVPDSNRWEVISFEQRRRVLSLLFNPECNLALAQINIIEHFARDIQELQAVNPLIHSKDVQKLTSFKMLKSLLRIKLKEYELNVATIQFKIVACSPRESLDLYISDWMTLEST